ncbi:MAG TPA: type VI secretion system baseplate subunit TssG [Geminicoccaceae bacterium]|nr:type VI secretion system baseplate subunit TssG [Geminicoccaceae bacterium]
MAAADRRGHSDVAEALRREPQAFQFFQAVRLLRLLRRRERAVGASGGDPVRFATHASLDFPASEVQALDPAEDGGPPRMTVNFMGLTGPSGVLPSHYTVALLERRIRYRDATAHRFFDIFNHRLLRLFYEAWEKYRFWARYERGEERDGLTRQLLDLVGLGTDGLYGRGAAGVPDERLAHFAGLAAQRPRSAAAVAATLGGVLGVPVRVLELRGRWLTVPERDRTRLGRANAGLGDTALVGRRAWEHQSSFRVRVGPLGRRQFDRFLPGAGGHEALVALTTFLVGPALLFDVQLVLRREEVPRLELSRAAPPRLGWTTWLATRRPVAADPDDVILSGQKTAEGGR